jgi:hypothetical protein
MHFYGYCSEYGQPSHGITALAQKSLVCSIKVWLELWNVGTAHMENLVFIR